jgi:hypothetical protein
MLNAALVLQVGGWACGQQSQYVMKLNNRWRMDIYCKGHQMPYEGCPAKEYVSKSIGQHKIGVASNGVTHIHV